MIAHRGELAAIATALLWTLSTLAWTSAGRRIGVVAVCVIRLVMAGVLLALYGQLTRGLALPVDATTRQWWILGLSGWFGFFVSDLCLFKAFQLIGPRLSLLLLALTPPAAAVIAWLFLAEPLAARQWLAMAMTLSGIVWVVLERRPPDVLPHPPGHLRLGVFWAWRPPRARPSAPCWRVAGSATTTPRLRPSFASSAAWPATWCW